MKRKRPTRKPRKRDGLNTVITLRIPRTVLDEIKITASCTGKTRTAFMVNCAHQRAIEVLIGQTRIVLKQAPLITFLRSLDHPAAPSSKLEGVVAGKPPVILSAPSPLSAQHDVGGFYSGYAVLDDWLKIEATRLTGNCYVVCAGERVVGYYALSAGEVFRSGVIWPDRRRRTDLPPVTPVSVLTRLAVSGGFRRQDIGKGLLKDALLRTLEMSRTKGVRAIMAHEVDLEAYSFLGYFGFMTIPARARTLFLAVGTIEKALEQTVARRGFVSPGRN